MRPRKKPRTPDARQVFDYAVWLLARQNYTRRGLLEKFATRFTPDPELFSATLEKLTRLGFQSDQNFAEAFVRSHPGWGVQRLKLELARKGIASELSAEVLPHASEAERCAEILRKKLRGVELPPSYPAKQKLAAFLMRRGFGFDTVKKTLGL